MTPEEIKALVKQEINKVYYSKAELKNPPSIRKKLNKIKWDMIDENSVCRKCGTSGHLTVDHIIPRSFLISIGADFHTDPENLELLCGMCNRLKGNRIEMDNPKTLPLLKKIINSL